MTSKHYISIPILLTKDDVSNLIDLDTRPINLTQSASFQTLADLNTQIVNQLAEFCVQYQTPEHLPISISMTPLLSLSRGIRHE